MPLRLRPGESLSNPSDRPAKSGTTTSLTRGLQSVFQGRLSFGRATLEAFRRGRAAVQSSRERGMLDELAAQPVRLRAEFLSLSSADLLRHFYSRTHPSFFPGLELGESTASRHRELFPDETERLINSARRIVQKHRWPLLGYGEKEFGVQINWHRDPLSGRIWPLEYHADILLWHKDGSDIRVLWELNRLGHLITLGQAYALTKEEDFAAEFFEQVEGWYEQNPVGRGANWSCAMEVAVRAMNLLAAFSLFRGSQHFTEERLRMLLTMFEQHGAHIRRNLEFSHFATSNHYLSDITGVLWLGIMLPELAAAEEWRAWALREMLRELDKQILADGVDYEGSTSYHCSVVELFLYSFLLCRINTIPIADKYWRKLRLMLEYLRAIRRPDGFVPLIADTDGGRVLPLTARDANDRGYLLALGAVAFNDSKFKLPSLEPPSELWWLLGEDGLQSYERLKHSNEEPASQAFPDAGTYVLRHKDLYLLFNAGGFKKGRPGSHRHNDLLSIEVSAGGRAFIVDPGSYVYTADLHERHLFRSTAYHSTVEVDRVEQNSIDQNQPFVIGNEAKPRMREWNPGTDIESLAAEHYGYQRLRQPVTHRRSVFFDKKKRYWFVSDELTGTGEHDLFFRFHFAPGVKVSIRSDGFLEADDNVSGARVLIQAGEANNWIVRAPELETSFSSKDYGEKEPSLTACWHVRTAVPYELNFVLVPVRPGEDGGEVVEPGTELRRLRRDF